MKFINRVGQTYGRLTVIERDTRSAGKVRWRCRCTCGTVIAVVAGNLTTGNTVSCGCFQQEQARTRLHKRRGVFADLTGRVFGRLTVMSFAGVLNGKPFWNCLCTCGAMKTVMAQSLRQCRTVSCGCYHREDAQRRATKHGRAGTAVYKRVYKQRREARQDLDVNWTRRMEQLLRTFQPTCVICNSPDDLTTDHVHPLASGRGLIPGNAVRLCRHCNSSKHAKPLCQLPDTWQVKISSAAAAFKQHWET